VKNQDFMGKTNYFLRTLPFSPSAISATWLLLRKYMKNEPNTCFQQKFAMGSYRVGIGRAWCSRKACEICSSLIPKKKLKKIIFLHTSCPNSNRPVFGLKEF
jgi:hypothetical protein